MNAGVYRFSQSTHTVAPVMRPGVTPAPGGGLFAGATFGVSLNNRGDLVFAGIVPTEQGIHLPDEDYIGLGGGLFKANKKGHISSVVSPGDPAPGGGVFDCAFGPWMNDRGDVAFTGHVAGDECRPAGSPRKRYVIGCLGSVYVKEAATGKIRSIAHAGDPAPGGGVYRQAKSPVINNRGDIVFLGDLTSPPAAYAGDRSLPALGRGDHCGGGPWRSDARRRHIRDRQQYHRLAAPREQRRRRRLQCTLDTDDNEDDHPGYRVVRVVARLAPPGGSDRHRDPGRGHDCPPAMNVFTVPRPPVFVPDSGAHNNDRGQVVFGATLSKR